MTCKVHRTVSANTRTLGTLLVLVVLSVYFWSQEPFGRLWDPTSGSVTEKEDTPFTLNIPDLPGYTGWARHEITDAKYYRVVSPAPPSIIEVGREWQIRVTCSQCQDHSPWFYLRAYGPAIITGTVSREVKGTYLFTFVPLDPGEYKVEAVLTFSDVPPVTRFPLAPPQIEPAYEGYVLPGFPRTLTVRPSLRSIDASGLPICSIDQLAMLDPPPTRYTRWRLVDSNLDPKHTKSVPGDDILLAGYQQSFQSLGYRFAYQRTDCVVMDIPSPTHNLLDACAASLPPNGPLNLILVGDSTMRLQKDLLENWLGNQIAAGRAHISFYELYGGLLRCERISGPAVSQIPVLDGQRTGKTIVLMNTGLHEIHRLCGNEWRNDRETYLSAEERERSCMDLYQNVVLENLFSNLLSMTNVDLFVYQTSTAAWPKYGNFGFAWDPARPQRLPLDPGFIPVFNDLAVDYILRNGHQRVQVLDAYWVSLARPDNREVGQKIQAGQKLSHPGFEVLYALVRQFSTVVLQSACPELLS